MFSVSVTLTLIYCKAFVCHQHNGSYNAAQGFKEKIKMNIAASTLVCRCKLGGLCLAACGAGLSPASQAQRLKTAWGGRDVSPGGWRLGPPRAGGGDNQEARMPHNLGFSKGNNAFQAAKSSPFIWDFTLEIQNGNNHPDNFDERDVSKHRPINYNHSRVPFCFSSENSFGKSVGSAPCQVRERIMRDKPQSLSSRGS